MTEENNQAKTAGGPNLRIVRVYVKDVSFESPHFVEMLRQEFKPEIKMQLDRGFNQIEENLFEVTLTVTVTSKQDEKVYFLVEVKQAGIFELIGFDDVQKDTMLGAYCPNTLFPFAREAVSDLVIKGGFPQLLLSPIDFHALHIQEKNQATAEVGTPGQAAH
jgi:preprotein translocase subunit SecB